MRRHTPVAAGLGFGEYPSRAAKRTLTCTAGEDAEQSAMSRGTAVGVRATVAVLCQCALPLSSNTVNYVADLMRAHLKAIGSRWRSRSAGQIAVLVLAVLVLAVLVLACCATTSAPPTWPAATPWRPPRSAAGATR
uniref:hypothetical protein n=1 Tax=Kitasatospora sp. NBC_01519 TaxID=2903576 RepID=UPI002F9162E6